MEQSKKLERKFKPKQWSAHTDASGTDTFVLWGEYDTLTKEEYMRERQRDG